jgi:hypothetical protein
MDARRARAPHRRIAAAVHLDISCPIWLNKACSPLILLGIPGPPPGLGQQGMQLSHRDVRSQLLSRWRFLAYQVRHEHACVALCWPQTAPQMFHAHTDGGKEDTAPTASCPVCVP